MVVATIDRPDGKERDRVAVEADHRFAAVILNIEVSAELSIVRLADLRNGSLHLFYPLMGLQKIF